jgi:peptidoglycan-N-acetylglucosamine deacetylase
MPTPPAPPHILTVDLEEWFHICGVGSALPRAGWERLESRVTGDTLALLALLDRYRARATFFVLGWVAEQRPELVREIARRGHEIASHGYFHQRVYTLTPRQFERDLRGSLEILTPLADRPIRGYRAPEWSIRDDSLWALSILARAGLCYDASMAPLPLIGNPRYARAIHVRETTCGTLVEVPPLVGATPWVNLPLGGGWGLRTFPYILIRAAMRQCHQRGDPAVLFLHPRDMGRRYPRTRLPWYKRFVVSGGLWPACVVLERLLAENRFTSVADYLLHWDTKGLNRLR